MIPDFTFDLAAMDFAAIQRWLASTYWSPGISLDRVEKGFRASTLCIGAFAEGRQIGVARCVSDTTRFAYVADVYVDEAFRKQGIAKTMVKRLMEHPLVADTEKMGICIPWMPTMCMRIWATNCSPTPNG